MIFLFFGFITTKHRRTLGRGWMMEVSGWGSVECATNLLFLSPLIFGKVVCLRFERELAQ